MRRGTRTTTAALAAGVLTAGGCAWTDGDGPPGPDAVAASQGMSQGTSQGMGQGQASAPSPGTGPGDGVSGPAVGETPTSEPPFGDPATVSATDPTTGAALTVTGIRAATHAGFDRVVFDLAGTGRPGWRVEYVEQALDDGSGNPVPVSGAAVLQVRISGTGIPADTGVGEYAGSPVTLPGGVVQEVVYRFVFEGYTTAFAGVDRQRPFRVFALQNPARLVIDVGR